MWVVTIGFANALRKVESDCWSLGVETAERAGGEVLAVIGGGGFAKKLVQVPRTRLRPWI